MYRQTIFPLKSKNCISTVSLCSFKPNHQRIQTKGTHAKKEREQTPSRNIYISFDSSTNGNKRYTFRNYDLIGQESETYIYIKTRSFQKGTHQKYLFKKKKQKVSLCHTSLSSIPCTQSHSHTEATPRTH